MSRVVLDRGEEWDADERGLKGWTRMGKKDWCRKTTWTTDDRESFFNRLKRSRFDHKKIQYLRIQARTLFEHGNTCDALWLLDYLLLEYPNDYFRGVSYEMRAEMLAASGEVDSAIRDYRTALEIERGPCPNVHTTAWCELPWLIAENKRCDLYEEAIKVLEFGERQQSIMFPTSAYICEAVRAVVADSSGNLEEACEHALKAIEAASFTHSGLRYHAAVGLVPQRYLGSKTHAQLLQIANAA